LVELVVKVDVFVLVLLDFVVDIVCVSMLVSECLVVVFAFPLLAFVNFFKHELLVQIDHIPHFCVGDHPLVVINHLVQRLGVELVIAGFVGVFDLVIVLA